MSLEFEVLIINIKIVEYINMIDDVHDDEAYQLAKNIVSKLVMYTRSHLEHEERILKSSTMNSP